MENYRIVKKIGAGNFAKVYLAVHTPTGKKVALKVIEKDVAPSRRQLLHKVRSEIRNMRRLQHRGIVEIYESFESETRFVIAMEYLPNGELFEYVWERQGLAEDEAREMFSRIVDGVQHCHKHSIVHRDLKLENILLDSKNHPKIVDFGFSKEVQDDHLLQTYCGSSLYASPEMIFGRPYLGAECDVWSLGVILYTMLSANMPFDDRDIPLFLRCIESGLYPQPANVSELCKDLLSRILEPRTELRITVDEILSHPWITKLSSSASSSSASTSSISITHTDCNYHTTAEYTDSRFSHTRLTVEKPKSRQRKDRPKALPNVLRKNSSGWSSGYSSDSSAPISTPHTATPIQTPTHTHSANLLLEQSVKQTESKNSARGELATSKDLAHSSKLFSRFHFPWKS